MNLLESLKRSAGRAAFEADRLMRTNRARGEIVAIEARIAEEQRQMGARLVDLYQAGTLPLGEFEEPVRHILRMRAEIGEKQKDMDAILAEQSAPDQPPQAPA